MEPAQEIKMVWENLALAMALWAGTKKGLITTAQVPTGRAAVPTDDGMVVEVFNPLELRSNQDLVRCINNQIRGAVTFSAMHTHGTMAQVFRSPPLREVDPDLRAARSALFLLYNTLSPGNAGTAVELPSVLPSTFRGSPDLFRPRCFTPGREGSTLGRLRRPGQVSGSAGVLHRLVGASSWGC